MILLDFASTTQDVNNRVTTCLENLEISRNLTAVKECQGKNLVTEKLQKTVYCKLQSMLC